MCDTQVILQNGATYFAKNSDREASEPQVIVRLAAVQNDPATIVQTTYIPVTQVPDRYGVILSKPVWIWGAEIGVNDQGVVIGNEAVFTRQVRKAGQALLGMDLLRLGLERGQTAPEALHAITSLLEEYGQGGPAGFRDKAFRYDNSFIIADAREAWILETAGKSWAAKKVKTYGAISNRLSIGAPHDLASNDIGEADFAKTHDTRFMAFMGKAYARQKLSLSCLHDLERKESASLAMMARNLRSHQNDRARFASHGNDDVCMHAGGLTRPSQSTGSMIVKIQASKAPQVMVTGTSAPCLSLFKPIDFDSTQPFFAFQDGDQMADQNLWHENEWVHRRALFDRGFADELCTSRDEVETRMMAVFEHNLPMNAAHELAADWHRQWQAKAREQVPDLSRFSAYGRYWRKMNALDGINWP